MQSQSTSPSEAAQTYRQLVHEMRNHLAAIGMAVFLLQANPDDDQLKEIVSALHKESQDARLHFEALVNTVNNAG